MAAAVCGGWGLAEADVAIAVCPGQHEFIDDVEAGRMSKAHCCSPPCVPYSVARTRAVQPNATRSPSSRAASRRAAHHVHGYTPFKGTGQQQSAYRPRG